MAARKCPARVTRVVGKLQLMQAAAAAFAVLTVGP